MGGGASPQKGREEKGKEREKEREIDREWSGGRGVFFLCCGASDQ